MISPALERLSCYLAGPVAMVERLRWKSVVAVLALLSSCVLPEFSVNPALDEDTTAGTGATTQAGSESVSSGSSSGGNNSSGGSSGGSKPNGGSPEGGAPEGGDPGVPVGGDGGCPEGRLACDGACKEENEARCGDCLHPCSGAESCTNHECVVCPTGCADLKTDAVKVGSYAMYLIDLGGPKNLNDSVISIKLFSNLNLYGVLKLVFYEGDNLVGLSYQLLPNVSGYIQTVDIVLANQPYYAQVTAFGFNVSAKGGDAAASQIFVDSISISGNPVGPWDFAEASSVNTLTYRPALSVVTGTVEWVKN